ncbi:hypothetical protein ACPCSP_25475 [Streptomyces cinereoruber]|uniref:hypothetical protein n=1 Tax=Streptomyces cinereoruber TaxID=67260 RepID=UPI003C2C1FC0
MVQPFPRHRLGEAGGEGFLLALPGQVRVRTERVGRETGLDPLPRLLVQALGNEQPVELFQDGPELVDAGSD